VAVVSVLGLIVSDSEMGGDHRGWFRNGLLLGAGLFAAGLLLSVLYRIAKLGSGGRCPACHRPVRKGHVYCEDHFREAINRSRDNVGIR
jgi:hypothetical protein